tara:strand:+ start:83 stop:415 length:333 start_codon:yes stop_codon:yes gene_type:complete
MRKIEQQMVKAIRNGVAWSSGNTCTTFNHDDDTLVFLHGHHIATVCKDGTVKVCDAGWQTNTTKSRLNAIINEFLDGTICGIFQKDFEWFIKDGLGIHDMYTGRWYTLTA